MSTIRRVGVLVVLGAMSFAGCCPLLELEARNLERRYARCTSDEQCVTYRYDDGGYTGDDLPGPGGSCVGTYSCGAALNVDSDLAAYTGQVRALSALHRMTCPACSQAMCSPPGSPYCDTSEGLCAFDRGGYSTHDPTRIETTPESLQFGLLQPGETMTMDLGIASIGDATLYVEAFMLVDQAPFVSAPFEVNDDRIERILAPGDSTSATVSCSPEVPGDTTGLLLVLSNAGNGALTQVPLSCAAGNQPASHRLPPGS